MSLADQLQTLLDQVRSLEAENVSLRRENRRLRLQQSKAKPIPAGASTPWSVLGISKDADEAAVLAAFRSLSKQHHPDCVGGDRTKFEALVAARDQLLSGRSS